MRLFNHDFAGHPFAAELSRELARRGHEVTHGHCGGVTTGRGSLARVEGDPPGLRFLAVSEAPFERYSPIGRLRSEVTYGRKLASLTRALRPDVVLSANCPLGAQAKLWRAARSVHARRAYWLQDFLGRGTRAVLDERSPWLGATFGRSWEELETRLLRRSDVVVAISEDFVDELRRRQVRGRVVVVHNWAPLHEVPERPKRTPWSEAHGLADRPVAMYSGTLGLKHDPEHLVAAAQRLEGTGAVVVVVTEGLGRDHLEARRRELGLDDLWLWDFVAWSDVPDLLGAADVCLVLLEPDAGRFSVPSKVLTYLAAGRAVIAAMPAENLATRTIAAAQAGTTLAPGDHDGFAGAIGAALADPVGTAAQGAHARQYAEVHFDIASIADAFERALRTG